ncbi:MAG: DUF86 domain-containing protein [Planctomyces sp.]|nr:DUF86 domain-containing protein [Planctomyces sp.]
MPQAKDDRAALWDMLTAARAVVSLVDGKTLDNYVADLMLRSAVERQVEIIGEAARRVSREFQDKHPEIPWRPIQAQRQVLAHEYGEIKHDRLWRVATLHVGELIEQLQRLVPEAPADDVNPAS